MATLIQDKMSAQGTATSAIVTAPKIISEAIPVALAMHAAPDLAVMTALVANILAVVALEEDANSQPQIIQFKTNTKELI